jgi:hypothetical protein
VAGDGCDFVRRVVSKPGKGKAKPEKPDARDTRGLKRLFGQYEVVVNPTWSRADPIRERKAARPASGRLGPNSWNRARTPIFRLEQITIPCNKYVSLNRICTADFIDKI